MGHALMECGEMYKLVSETNARTFEEKVSELLKDGYQAIGDLKVDRRQMSDHHGAWYWETLYTREFAKQDA